MKSTGWPQTAVLLVTRMASEDAGEFAPDRNKLQTLEALNSELKLRNKLEQIEIKIYNEYICIINRLMTSFPWCY